MIRIPFLSNDFMKGEAWEDQYHREIAIDKSTIVYTGENHQVHVAILNPSHEQVIDDIFLSPDTATFIAHCLLKQAELCKKANLINQLELFATQNQ